MKIEELQKVIQELPLNRRMKPNLLGQKKDNVDKLYDLIKKGKISSEQDAIQQIYPHNRYPARSLWKIKEKLIERIGVSLTILFPILDVGVFQKKHLEGFYYFFILKICIALRINSLIETFGSKSLKIGIEYHITELCLITTMYLRGYYLVQSSDKKEFCRINKLYKKYLKLHRIESKLEDLQIELLMQFRDKISYDQNRINELEKIYKTAISLPKKSDSYRILFRLSYIKSTYFHATMEYSKATQIIEETQNKMNGMSMTPFQKHLFTLEFKKIPGYIIQKDFASADEVITRCLEITQKKSYNHLITKQIKVLMLFHKTEFENAFKIINGEFNSGKIRDEIWEIYHAYATILTNQHFRLRRFLNQVPIFSKDKKGMNINILIIEILDYLRKKLYYKIIDRTAALQRYCYRYLNDDRSTYRSYQFFQIILCLEKGAFCKKEVDPLVAKHLQALKDHPLSEAQQDYELEIVPYEHLWKFMRNYLR
jgi:hypothetical protein